MIKKNPKRPKIAIILASLLTFIVIIANIFLKIDEPIYIKIFALLFLFISCVFIVIPFFQLQKYKKKREPYFSTNKIINTGIYKITRHPQYLGYCLFVIGFALLTPHPIIIGSSFLAVLLFYIQSLYEERYCIKIFSKDYKIYMEKVPRFNIFLGLFRLFRGRKKNIS